MNREDVLDTFQFQDDRVLDDHVDPIAAIKGDILVFDRKGYLALERKATEMKFVTEALFVSRFEQPRA